jgi:hypothetical protein
MSILLDGAALRLADHTIDVRRADAKQRVGSFDDAA